VSTLEAIDWWRRICWVTPQLALCGDLGDDIGPMKRHLSEWVGAGITHIVDVRVEADDTTFVARLAPHITYHWLGVDDDGGRRADEWFDAGAAAVVGALADPSARVMVHCHMGVNRGPSMLFAAMLALGHHPLAALAVIRRQRPIAAVLYAEDAVRWWAARTGSGSSHRLDVRRWQKANPLDTEWIVHRLWTSSQSA
jgi:dual specificity phosphatase 3